MCLSMVDPKPMRKYGVGYKLARRDSQGRYWCFDYGPHAGKVEYIPNRWITDPNDGEATGACSNGAGYRTGFHISLSSETLKPLMGKLIKVRFRKVTATQSTGHSTYGKQVVAREMMMLGEVVR